MSRFFAPIYILLFIAGIPGIYDLEYSYDPSDKLGIPGIYDLEYSYDPSDKLGPEKWSSEYIECAGKYQSPINIDETSVIKVSFSPLKFSGLRELSWTATLQNNGHTVMLTLNSTIPIQISDGPLSSTYSFEQLHFHWGVDNSVGSEHIINHKSFPMELHQVYFNNKYGRFKEALKHKDGLVVLASFFKISEVDNRAYTELVDGLKMVEATGNSITLPYMLPLEYLLPINRERYFIYHGSLTTPPCSEVVTWINLIHPLLISDYQIKQFRRLQGAHGPLTHNARPTQPLNGRQVFYSYEHRTVDQPACLVLAVNTILSLFYGCNY